MSNISSYPPPVQKVLRRLQLGYGNTATNLAVQALEMYIEMASGDERFVQSSVLSEEVITLLRMAYRQCCLQTGEEWVHQARLYTAVYTIEPSFTYKPQHKTWPKFLLAQTSVYETQFMKEQLYVRMISPPLEQRTPS